MIWPTAGKVPRVVRFPGRDGPHESQMGRFLASLASISRACQYIDSHRRAALVNTAQTFARFLVRHWDVHGCGAQFLHWVILEASIGLFLCHIQPYFCGCYVNVDLLDWHKSKHDNRSGMAVLAWHIAHRLCAGTDHLSQITNMRRFRCLKDVEVFAIDYMVSNGSIATLNDHIASLSMPETSNREPRT